MCCCEEFGGYLPLSHTTVFIFHRKRGFHALLLSKANSLTPAISFFLVDTRSSERAAWKNNRRRGEVGVIGVAVMHSPILENLTKSLWLAIRENSTPRKLLDTVIHTSIKTKRSQHLNGMHLLAASPWSFLEDYCPGVWNNIDGVVNIVHRGFLAPLALTMDCHTWTSWCPESW